MKKTLSESIQGAIKQGTQFAFHKELTIEPVAGANKNINRDKFYDLKVSGALSIEHAFVLQAIHALGGATTKMIRSYMYYEAKKYPEKLIPTWEHDKMVSQLRYLSSLGLIICYDFTSAVYKRRVFLYTCTNFGHQYFRNVLNLGYYPYDDNVVFRADPEVFKHLAINSVCLNFGAHPKCTGLYFNGRYDTREYKDTSLYVYAAAEFGDKVFVIEPCYFIPDERIETAEEVKQRVASRLSRLHEVITSYREKRQKEAHIVFCFEDMIGMKNFVEIASKMNDAEYMFSAGFYTCENVFHRNGGNLNESFMIRKAMDEGKVSFVPAKDNWL